MAQEEEMKSYGMGSQRSEFCWTVGYLKESSTCKQKLKHLKLNWKHFGKKSSKPFQKDHFLVDEAELASKAEDVLTFSEEEFYIYWYFC